MQGERKTAMTPELHFYLMGLCNGFLLAVSMVWLINCRRKP